MLPKEYHRGNFHKYTFCIFTEVDSSILSSLKLNYKSKSGSSYFFTIDGVYRLSNHWGRAANCKWRLIPMTNPPSINGTDKRTKLGFANWTDFYPDNDYEKLYFIEVDFDKSTVTFNHKLSLSYTPDKVLRTASDTTKLIKQIRSLLEDDAWAKHMSVNNLTILRKEIIIQLLTSTKSFNQIRSEIVGAKK